MRVLPSSLGRNLPAELLAEREIRTLASASTSNGEAALAVGTPRPLRDGRTCSPGRERSLPSVGARLREHWRRGETPSVEDTALAEGVDALIEHLTSEGFFRESLEGMDRASFGGSGVSYAVQLAPHRSAPRAASSAKDGCVLCLDASSREPRLAWRSYWVRANHFPYVPAEQRHVMLLPREHRIQSCTREVLSDAIDFHAALGRRRPAVAFYNGFAGNSQYHLHWHAIYDRTPLEHALDGGELGRAVLRASGRGAVLTFDRGPYAGIVVQGSKDYLVDFVLRITHRLDRDPRTSIVGPGGARVGTYNLALLTPRDGHARLLVIPRRASCLRPEVDGTGPYAFGAYVLLGVFIHDGERATEALADSARKAARETVLPPSQIEWLRDIAREPESNLIAFRATSAQPNLE